MIQLVVSKVDTGTVVINTCSDMIDDISVTIPETGEYNISISNLSGGGVGKYDE